MIDEIGLVQRRLEEEGEKMLAFFEGLPGADWAQTVYVDGSGWTVRDLLAHFLSAEQTYVEYIRRLLRGEAGLPPDFDLNAFNEAEVPRLTRLSTNELLGALRSARAATVTTVAGLVPGDLECRGWHPWLGDTDLGSVLKLLYRHPMIHLRDVRRALKTGKPVRSSEGSEGGEEAGG